MREWYRRNTERGRQLARESRARNLEEIRARDRARGMRETDPRKIKARNAARQLRKEPQPCEVCGKQPAEAHHGDYNKPLEVRWLCKTHHAMLHRTVLSFPLGDGSF
jgi:hypothetical protein